MAAAVAGASLSLSGMDYLTASCFISPGGRGRRDKRQAFNNVSQESTCLFCSRARRQSGWNDVDKVFIKTSGAHIDHLRARRDFLEERTVRGKGELVLSLPFSCGTCRKWCYNCDACRSVAGSPVTSVNLSAVLAANASTLNPMSQMRLADEQGSG